MGDPPRPSARWRLLEISLWQTTCAAEARDLGEDCREEVGRMGWTALRGSAMEIGKGYRRDAHRWTWVSWHREE